MVSDVTGSLDTALKAQASSASTVFGGEVVSHREKELEEELATLKEVGAAAAAAAAAAMPIVVPRVVPIVSPRVVPLVLVVWPYHMGRTDHYTQGHREGRFPCACARGVCVGGLVGGRLGE